MSLYSEFSDWKDDPVLKIAYSEAMQWSNSHWTENQDQIMILAVDVDYKNNDAYIAGVLFEKWSDEKETSKFKSTLNNIEEYESGKFYRRELPCIIKLIEEHNLKSEIIVIDGFVWLDGKVKPGLGAYLYEALEDKVAIIGVAKKSFIGISSKYKLYRGKSKKPLYVTSAGIELIEAMPNIEKMAGENRIPILLKIVDRLCRER